HTASELNRARSVWGRVARTNVCHLDNAISGKVATRDHRVYVLLVDIRAGDPARAINYARVNEVPDAGGRLFAEYRASFRPRPDVALNERGVLLEVILGGSLNLSGREGNLGTLIVDFAVARNANDNYLARTVEVRQCQH